MGVSPRHPAPAGGRARSLSHPFGPAFVSVGIRLGVRREKNLKPKKCWFSAARIRCAGCTSAAGAWKHKSGLGSTEGDLQGRRKVEQCRSNCRGETTKSIQTNRDRLLKCCIGLVTCFNTIGDDSKTVCNSLPQSAYSADFRKRKKGGSQTNVFCHSLQVNSFTPLTSTRPTRKSEGRTMQEQLSRLEEMQ